MPENHRQTSMSRRIRRHRHRKPVARTRLRRLALAVTLGTASTLATAELDMGRLQNLSPPVDTESAAPTLNSPRVVQPVQDSMLATEPVLQPSRTEPTVVTKPAVEAYDLTPLNVAPALNLPNDVEQAFAPYTDRQPRDFWQVIEEYDIQLSAAQWDRLLATGALYGVLPAEALPVRHPNHLVEISPEAMTHLNALSTDAPADPYLLWSNYEQLGLLNLNDPVDRYHIVHTLGHTPPDDYQDPYWGGMLFTGTGDGTPPEIPAEPRKCTVSVNTVISLSRSSGSKTLGFKTQCSTGLLKKRTNQTKTGSLVLTTRVTAKPVHCEEKDWLIRVDDLRMKAMYTLSATAQVNVAPGANAKATFMVDVYDLRDGHTGVGQAKSGQLEVGLTTKGDKHSSFHLTGKGSYSIKNGIPLEMNNARDGHDPAIEGEIAKGLGILPKKDGVSGTIKLGRSTTYSFQASKTADAISYAGSVFQRTWLLSNKAPIKTLEWYVDLMGANCAVAGSGQATLEGNEVIHNQCHTQTSCQIVKGDVSITACACDDQTLKKKKSAASVPTIKKVPEKFGLCPGKQYKDWKFAYYLQGKEHKNPLNQRYVSCVYRRIPDPNNSEVYDAVDILVDPQTGQAKWLERMILDNSKQHPAARLLASTLDKIKVRDPGNPWADIDRKTGRRDALCFGCHSLEKRNPKDISLYPYTLGNYTYGGRGFPGFIKNNAHKVLVRARNPKSGFHTVDKPALPTVLAPSFSGIGTQGTSAPTAPSTGSGGDAAQTPATEPCKSKPNWDRVKEQFEYLLIEAKFDQLAQHAKKHIGQDLPADEFSNAQAIVGFIGNWLSFTEFSFLTVKITGDGNGVCTWYIYDPADDYLLIIDQRRSTTDQVMGTFFAPDDGPQAYAVKAAKGDGQPLHIFQEAEKRTSSAQQSGLDFETDRDQTACPAPQHGFNFAYYIPYPKALNPHLKSDLCAYRLGSRFAVLILLDPDTKLPQEINRVFQGTGTDVATQFANSTVDAVAIDDPSKPWAKLYANTGNKQSDCFSCHSLEKVDAGLKGGYGFGSWVHTFKGYRTVLAKYPTSRQRVRRRHYQDYRSIRDESTLAIPMSAAPQFSGD